jgi:FAD/FMN-containing dehydrogenase
MERVVERLGLQNSSAVSFALFKTAPTNTPDNAIQTSANPAWRDSYWHMLAASAWPSGTSNESIAAIRSAAGDALDEVKNILPYQAAYTNEADILEKDWQQVFYGSNYGRLAAIKRKYDPTNFFNVYKGIDWLGEKDPAYSCYTDQPVPSVPSD